MKAEHRKELETNTLADRMGVVMQRVKSGQRRTAFIYVVIALAVVVGLFVLYRWWTRSRLENSDQWVRIYDGSHMPLRDLALNHPDTPQGKVARFQIAWMTYEQGIKVLGVDPKDAILSFTHVKIEYDKLASDCKGDEIFEPQALLGRAVAAETLAIQTTKNLEEAQTFYQEVVEKYGKSAQGAFAQARLDQLKDRQKRLDLVGVYETLQKAMNVPTMQQPGHNFPFLDEKQKKAKAPAK
jgi:hypothetical protein